MTKFLIEVQHESSKAACLRELDAYLQAGAHYLTNAEWGCMANDRRAWLTVDVASEAEAKMLVPPVARHKAKVTPLNKFTPEQAKEFLSQLH